MWQKCDKIKLINCKTDWYKLIIELILVGNSLQWEIEEPLKYQRFSRFSYAFILEIRM